ncbi:hypothetical protein M153_3400008428, partial [Pseudoloma neurophilia]
IEHHVVGIEAHRSNGRVERVIRTIRDGIMKLDEEMSLKKKMKIITEKYVIVMIGSLWERDLLDWSMIKRAHA